MYSRPMLGKLDYWTSTIWSSLATAQCRVNWLALVGFTYPTKFYASCRFWGINLLPVLAAFWSILTLTWIPSNRHLYRVGWRKINLELLWIERQNLFQSLTVYLQVCQPSRLPPTPTSSCLSFNRYYKRRLLREVWQGLVAEFWKVSESLSGFTNVIQIVGNLLKYILGIDRKSVV